MKFLALTDWAKNLADELAAAGYIAIAPDLLIRSRARTRAAIPTRTRLSKPSRRSRRRRSSPIWMAAADDAAKLPAGNGSLAVTGFLLGRR